MTPSLLILASSALFTLMGLCVKLASAQYNPGEVVLYRSLTGLLLMGALLRLRGQGWRTAHLGMHLKRSASGTLGLCCWFTALGALPLATAMTLNYMSSVWVAVFLVVGAMLARRRSRADTQPVDLRLVAAVLVGFVGVALVLRPTIAQDQWLHGLLGLMSGMLSALAYLQVSALGRVGEPGERVVFYFSLVGCVAGVGLTWAMGGPNAHTWRGAGLLLAIGVLATAAQWLLTRAYSTGATMGVAALQYAGIVYSVLLGVWLFHDRLSGLTLAGMALIIAAGVAATLLGNRQPNRPSNLQTAPAPHAGSPTVRTAADT